MPFHIDHSGSAPISTYFRVKKAELRAPSPHSPTGESAEEAMETVELAEEPTQIDTEGTAMDVEPTPSNLAKDASLPSVLPITPKASSLKERFVAAFRGRTVHGATVELPPGYAGIVLRGEGEGKSTAMKAPKETAKRATRRSRAMDIDGDGNEGYSNATVDIEDPLDSDDTPTKTLNPSATFSSFVLWNADNPVDEGRDEYLRSLTEWTRLAAEVNTRAIF
jgi:hypothetical protein